MDRVYLSKIILVPDVDSVIKEQAFLQRIGDRSRKRSLIAMQDDLFDATGTKKAGVFHDFPSLHITFWRALFQSGYLQARASPS